MRLTANRPCIFGGKKFLIGEEIPVELVANPKAQAKMGVLTISGSKTLLTALSDSESQGTAVGPRFIIPLQTDSGEIILSILNDELIMFAEIRQTGVNSAEDKQKISALIQKIVSNDLLIMLDALDGRKHVKEAAQARAQELSDKGGE